MRIQLSDHFTYGRLFRFTFPSIIMMVFTSIYSVVDGFFISNYVGKVPFAALNLVMPLFIILGSVGFMLGSGGNAIVARTLGEGDRSKANRYFSFLVLACMGLGLLVFLVGFASLSPIARFLGASGEILGNSVLYGRIVLCGMPFFMLQNLFQSFCITAERPKLGLAFTVASGLANMILDALFVAVFKWGLAGAAWATVISEVVGGLGPVFYFPQTEREPFAAWTHPLVWESAVAILFQRVFGVDEQHSRQYRLGALQLAVAFLRGA